MKFTLRECLTRMIGQEQIEIKRGDVIIEEGWVKDILNNYKENKELLDSEVEHFYMDINTVGYYSFITFEVK